MIATLVLALSMAISSEPYARSRTDASDPYAHCTFWLQNSTITYHQNSAGNNEIANDAEFTAANKAFASWQSKLDACGSLKLVEGARSASRSVGWVSGRNDNQNLVLYRAAKCEGLVPRTDTCWVDDNCGNKFDCWQYSAEALAITTSNFDPKTGRLLDADIELDQANYVFTVVDSPVCPRDPSGKIICALNCVCTDIQNTMTHEVGHLLGLDHTLASGSIMVPRADSGELSKRTIDNGSAQFVCDVYPKGDVAKDCVTKPYNDVLGKAYGCGCSSAALPGLLGLGAVWVWWRGRRKHG